MARFFLLFTALFFIIPLQAQVNWYVSPAGDDMNAGSIGQPFKTITTAVTAASAGDTIYLRGGSHLYTGSASTIISIGKTGTVTARYYLYAYPGEKPVLDFSATALNAKGVKLSGGYWHFKGIDFYGAGGNGLIITGINANHNIIEQCAFYENRNSGLQIENLAADNQVINCDSYYNADPANGNADGFAPKLDVGQNNFFYGCRSWQNSDDGWDGYLNDNVTDISTILENCWCFRNGYLKTGLASAGNGNGFKTGGSSAKTSMHNMTLKKCLSFYNRVKGFDQNNNKGNITFYNCTGYGNGTNYGLNSSGYVNTAAGKQITIKNCVSFGATNTINALSVQEKNSWLTPFVVDNTDFVSVDTTGVTGARQPDGNLPELPFMHLASGSDLVNAGVDVGLSFYGTAPDLGAFETNIPIPVGMLSFMATLKNSSVLLNWSVANEFNNRGWTIERAALNNTGSIIWQSIGFVSGAGNSAVTTYYGFRDNGPINTTYQYRLKQEDGNGRLSYSHIIVVRAAMNAGVPVVSASPNPFTSYTTLRYTVPVNGKVELTIFTSGGQLVSTIINEELEKGVYSKLVNLTALPAGKYIIQLKTVTGTITGSMLKMY